MKTINKFLSRLATSVAVLVAVAAIGFGGTAQARIQYSPNGNGTSATPVFNQFYDVPNGVGDEADFVRVKPKAGGNGDYVNALNDACNVGSSFNVRTYVHNGADPSLNGNGSGSAVARNVVLRQTAPLNKSQNSFKFDSTISASNAASVSDSATLNCNGKTVKLSLVANSVQTYSKPLGFQGAPDSSVNGSLSLGSRVQGSGNVWACWDDRVIVVYEVKVEEVPVVVTGDGVCKVNDVVVLNQDKRNIRATVNGVTTGQGASIVGYEINWGDGSAVSNKQTDTHTYAKDGTYRIVGRVQVKLADGTTKWVTSTECTRTVKFEAGKPPVVPPVTPPTTVTTLPVTGAGNLFGIFAGTSALAAGAHQIVTRRRAARS